MEKELDNIIIEEKEEKIQVVDIVHEMRSSFLDYAMSTIVARALPDVRDGLKPVHRRILYAMHVFGFTYDSATKKCARIVGDVMGKYHPHGNISIYDSLVRMAQEWSFRYPLIHPQGNFGSIDGDGAAADRYTEAKLSKISSELLRDINKETVNYISNFDGSEVEPVILPCRFPNLLVNGSSGIAVGMSTNIPPHNLIEVVNALVALIKDPNISIEGLMSFISGPDFPTGGIIMGLSQVRKAYLTGRGILTLQAKYTIETSKTGKKRMVITQLPFPVKPSEVLEKIDELVKKKEIEGISEWRDETDKYIEGPYVKIVIEFKQDANEQVVVNNLFKRTQLQASFGINMLALDKNQPKVLNLKEILSKYLAHQIDIITRRTEFDLDKAKSRIHILEGLIIALNNIDEVIRIIKTSDTIEETLMKRFSLTEIQVKSILVMQLQKLAHLEVEKFREELSELRNFAKDCEEILNSKERKNKIIISDLLEIRDKYGDERRSQIILSEDLDIEEEDLIPREDVLITVSGEGYVKRMSVENYKTQNKGGQGLQSHKKQKEEDYIKDIRYTSTHDWLYFFSSIGKVYRLKAFRIPEISREAKGKPIVNLLNFSEGEKLKTIISIPEGKEKEGYLMFLTKRGLVKKTEMIDYENIRQNGIIALNLNEGDEVVSVVITGGSKDIIIGASNGKAIRFSEANVRPMKRIAAGVIGILIEPNQEAIGMAVIHTDGDEIVIVTDKGYGKRINVDEFKVQIRGGKGVKALNITSKNGKMVSFASVKGEEDLIVVTDKGMTIRTPLSQILTVKRDTIGSRVIRLKESDFAATITIVPKSEENVETSYEEDVTNDINVDYEFE